MQADTAFLQALANVLAAALVRSEAEAAKDALLQDKDMLMREVHHRVSNSLQLVRTMLALQSRGASDEVRGQLDNASGRIMSIAAVHRRLYEGGSVVQADAAAYLRGLIDDMADMLADARGDRRVVLTAEPTMLPADSLTPLGLIVSELITNALKYGAGVIRVEVRRASAGMLVTVDDEGGGFPPETPGGTRRGARDAPGRLACEG